MTMTEKTKTEESEDEKGQGVQRCVMRKCAACGKEKPSHKMDVCMHNQMHNYVCDSKCMTKFYA